MILVIVVAHPLHLKGFSHTWDAQTYESESLEMGPQELVFFKISRDDLHAQPGLKLLILKELDSRGLLLGRQCSQPVEAGVRTLEFQSQHPQALSTIHH